jgi:hypothetical protein
MRFATPSSMVLESRARRTLACGLVAVVLAVMGGRVTGTPDPQPPAVPGIDANLPFGDGGSYDAPLDDDAPEPQLDAHS